MTAQVLTDQEIVRLSLDLASVLGAEAFVKTVRDVEAAVLAKVDGIKRELESTGRLVTEREARTRERAAFTDGWRQVAERDVSGLTGRTLDRSLDKFYPLPTKRVPVTVHLSNGTEVKWNESSERFSCSDNIAAAFASTVFALAKTPADARLLADLVENPYKEVPSDD